MEENERQVERESLTNSVTSVMPQEENPEELNLLNRLDRSTLNPFVGSNNQLNYELHENQSAIRYILSFLAAVGMCLVYALRVNQNIAIIAMTDKNSTLPDHKIYNWTEPEKNAIIASFSYGYVSSQILGGVISDKFNLAGSVLGIGVLGTSILTSFVPIVADYGYFYLCCLRCGIGVLEGVTFPSLNSFWGKWAPPNERTRLLSWSCNGSSLGTVFGSIVTGFLSTIPGLGWQASFYGFSFLGMIWSWLWFIIASDTPRENDWIDNEELEYIETSLGVRMVSSRQGSFRRKQPRLPPVPEESRVDIDSQNAADGSVDEPLDNVLNDQILDSSDIRLPVKKVFTCLPFYALIITHWCYGWLLYTFFNELPLFCNEVLGLGPGTTSIFTSIPSFTSWVIGLVIPAFVDELIKKYDRNLIRKISQSICFFGSALIMILIIGLGFSENL